MTLLTQLRELYDANSKHSQYQNVPDYVQKHLGIKTSMTPLWRDDHPRLDFIINNTPATPGRIVEIGANIGFFGLSLARHYPSAEIICFEGNRDHATFIELVAREFKMKNIVVENQYICASDLAALPSADLCINMNVLHHAGREFDIEHMNNTREWQDYFVAYMQDIRKFFASMWLQVGYNWGGDKTTPLFDSMKPLELFSFLQSALPRADWAIELAGISKLNDKGGAYHYNSVQMDAHNTVATRREVERLARVQSEFFRRPLLLLK